MAGIDLINTGPHDTAELVAVFEGASLDDLASGWVGCMVDSLLEYGPPPASAFARCAGVVATRLKHASFATPLIMPTPEILLTRTKNGAGIMTNATGFEVMDSGAPPAPKKGQRGYDPLSRALIDLKPGQHIKIAKDRMPRATLNSRVMSAKKRGGHKGLRCYEAFSGDLIAVVDATR